MKLHPLLLLLTAVPGAALAAPLPETGLILADGEPPALRETQPQVPARTLQAWRRFGDAGGRGWIGYFDAITGAPGRVWGAGIAVPGASASAEVAAAHARAFLREHADLLAPGAKAEDFVLVSNHDDGRMRTLGFVQTYRGLRVAGGQVNFRYKNDRLFMLGSDALSDVAPTLAARPLDEPSAARAARAWIERAVGGSPRVEGHKGQLILPIREEHGLRLVHVVEVRVRTTQPAGLYAVYLEAGSGEPVARRQLLMFGSGQVAFNTPVRRPGAMRVDRGAVGVTVTVDGARQTADLSGNITWTSTAPASVQVGPVGPLVRVANDSGALASSSGVLQPAGQLVWNAASDERVDAQLTAYMATQDVKTYVRRLQPTMPWLDQQMVVNVNINDVCNAFSDGETTNFFLSGMGCENTARLPDVVAHEAGHTVHFYAVIEGVGAWETALSEGVSDYLAATMTNDQGMGRGFFFTNEALRELDPALVEKKWPDDINRDPHETGLIIGGALWDLRKEYVALFGEETGVRMTDDTWFAIIQRASDIPSTYAEAIALDDDDGDLSNGTPHQCVINGAFGRHGLVDRVNAGPGIGVPTFDAATRQLVFPFMKRDNCPGSTITRAQILWSVRGDAAQAGTIDMVLQAGASSFAGVVPAPAEPGVVRYRVEIGFDDGASVVFPDNPADPSYEIFVGEVIPLYCIDFEDDPNFEGWTHALEAGMPGGGGFMPVDDWEWGAPREIPNSRDPLRAHSARNVIGNDLGLATMGRRIDGRYQSNSTTALYSPMIDTQGHTQVRLQYWRWLTVEDGLKDKATIYGNGTALWTNVASEPAEDPLFQTLVPHVDKEWRFHDVDLSSTIVDGHVQVEYELVADRRTTLGGWTLDDFCVVAVAVCGNGKVEMGEECDDSNRTDGDGCTPACRVGPVAPVCGNAMVEMGEECDDGVNDGTACTATCTTPPPPAPVCGNGRVEAGEACDDGVNDGKQCTATCALPAPVIKPIEEDGGCGCTAAPRPSAGAQAALLLGLVWLAARRRKG